MQIPIDDIKIGRRARKGADGIEPLMDSLKRYGLLNPITVNAHYRLIAGARRLEAARRLGWRTINAVILEETDRALELELEIEENTQRLNLSDDELLAAFTRLERLKNPSILARIWRAIADFFKYLLSLLFPRRS